MKRSLAFIMAVTLGSALTGNAQTVPGAPETNGLTPKTITYYINTPTNGLINGNSEAEAIAIASNGNIMVGWEDDGDAIRDIEAVWTLFDSNGNWLLTNTVFTPIFTDYGGTESITNKFVSYYRADGSATPGYVSWGPKLHANLFGSGIGQGANGDSILMPAEVAALADYSPGGEDDGNFPVVQLFDDNGAKRSEVLAGISAAYHTSDPAAVRIGDWEWLSTGNIVIFGDSRQNNDLVNLYGGTNPANHTIFRILSPTGAVVKAETLANDVPVGSSMWHGAGVTSNGFAVRFSDSTRGTVVRMFDNAGTPTTPDLVLSTLVDPRAGGGDRGDGVGFHGNGKDAYAYAANYSSGGTNGVWLSVLNADGTVRWSRDVYDDLTLQKVDRGDCAINENGEVVVVFGVQYDLSLPLGVAGRRFDATGKPVGGSFYISEIEVPDVTNTNLVGDATYARVAWRNGHVAVTWGTKNDPANPGVTEIALRIFADPALMATAAGNTVTISWPTNFVGFTLQSTTNLMPAGTWQSVVTTNNTLTLTNPLGQAFYRLMR